MRHKSIALILTIVIICVSAGAYSIGAYATEETDSAESSESTQTTTSADGTTTTAADGTTSEDKDSTIAYLEESIKEKQEALSKANEEKKSIQSSITDVKKMVSSLESEKENLTNYVTQLDSNLATVQEKIDSLNALIEEKEADIAEAEADLNESIAARDEQYKSMKSRIKFMYEKGNNYYAELLLTSKSFGDMINKADFIEQLSSYDQKVFAEYKTNCEYIEACRTALDAEKEVLEEAKAEVEIEEDNLSTLIEAKEQEITSTESDISNKEEAIKEYEAYLAEQTAVVKALEDAVAAEQKRLAEENGEITTYDGGTFCWPAPSYTYISSEFGNRLHPTLGVYQFHNGLDMAAPGGSPILAAYDGEVVAATYSSTMGNYIIINHGDGLYTVYMHASALYVSEGAQVTRGQKIAAVGSTGRSTGNHLHFSVRLNGSYVSPWNYITAP